MNYINIAKEVAKVETEAILATADRLDVNFCEIVEAIKNSNGRVVFSGMGKSGHIAKKIFATFISTGTPSMFLHPGEAFHGDLGMVMPEDIFIAISNSGETDELVRLIPFLKDNGNKIVAMTGAPENSTLGISADYTIDISVAQEACPLNLAPTSSTTATLVMGDALAISLMYAKRFSSENFARFHPGGALGRRLLGMVSDYSEEALVLNEESNFTEIISSISNSKAGIVVVANKMGICGVVTSGDLNRALLKNNKVLTELTAKDIMNTNPSYVTHDLKCKDADLLMKNRKINSLILSLNKKFYVYNNFNG